VKALTATLRITAMVFLILAGATVFGRFLVLTRLPFLLTEWVCADADLAPAMILLFMMGCYLVGGCMMDALAFLLISLPLFEPLVTQHGLRSGLVRPGRVPGDDAGRDHAAGRRLLLRGGGHEPDANSAQVFRGAMRFLPAYSASICCSTSSPA
jgi:hypothetical protein